MATTTTNQSSRDLLKAWCRINVHDERAPLVTAEDIGIDADATNEGAIGHSPADVAAQTAQKRVPGDGLSLKGKTVILVHEAAPSTLEGGDFRS